MTALAGSVDSMWGFIGEEVTSAIESVMGA
jgi:hypothetical protein